MQTTFSRKCFNPSGCEIFFCNMKAQKGSLEDFIHGDYKIRPNDIARPLYNLLNISIKITRFNAAQEKEDTLNETRVSLIRWIKISCGNLKEPVRARIYWTRLSKDEWATLLRVQDQVARKATERIHRCWNPRGKVEEGGSGQPAEMCFWKMCGRTATVLTLMASGYARVPTKAGCERPGWGSTSLPRVRAYVLGAHACVCVCAHAALFIRAVNQGRYDITLCETKRDGRVRRADMFRYVALGDRDNARANAEVNSRRI